jgi:hypothetical protein
VSFSGAVQSPAGGNRTGRTPWSPVPLNAAMETTAMEKSLRKMRHGPPLRVGPGRAQRHLPFLCPHLRSGFSTPALCKRKGDLSDGTSLSLGLPRSEPAPSLHRLVREHTAPQCHPNQPPSLICPICGDGAPGLGGVGQKPPSWDVEMEGELPSIGIPTLFLGLSGTVSMDQVP